MHVEDDALRQLAALVSKIDQLDAEAAASDEPYADVQLDAVLVAKRDVLLIELDVVEVFDPTQRERLSRLGLQGLVDYCDAAAQLDQYLRSPGYTRLVKVSRPSTLQDSVVSLDWFRRPSRYVPAGVDPYDWLALCEANFRAGPRPKAGSLFVKLERQFHRLMFRTELGRPKLYCAVLA